MPQDQGKRDASAQRSELLKMALHVAFRNKVPLSAVLEAIERANDSKSNGADKSA